jgi:hypothetical protein
MRRAFLMAGLCTTASMVAAACMSRPVATTEPQTSNLYVEPIRNDVIKKIDLLFMIDNSASMGDKQVLLAKAVPQLVDRLVIPRCTTPTGTVVLERKSLSEACPAGSAPEFRAVQDIHIAVISSSLGAHGAKTPVGGCGDAPPGNDRARLLPSVRPGLVSYDNSGFLAWDPNGALNPAGETDPVRLGMQFGEMVQKTGENGCGFEASLESWYRFLIDPEPPVDVSIDAVSGRGVPGQTDVELLAQRAAFLRPDSLVAIVMLTDENDCSIRDDEYGHWLSTSQKSLPRGTTACAVDPNDRCCLPCTVTGGVPDGCTPVASDPACAVDEGTFASDTPENRSNMRCFENQRRFGYDFLYPISRYVDGLTKLEVPRRSDGKMVPNPLFTPAPGKPRRAADLVYLAGIVGVPWQDIADDASQNGPGLRYLTAAELTANNRWEVIVGDRSKNQRPTDPFMQESMAPRSGINPVTKVAITPETSPDPRANPINGHEQANPDNGDLQYACTFPLPQSEVCDPKDQGCDCAEAATDGRNRPLCQPPGGGPPGTTQYFGKAYPGLRPLEVLKGVGDSAIVASICPKILVDDQPGYGYEPAVDAIVERLKVALQGRCPPRPLAVEPGSDGELPCVVVEALEQPDQCGCTAAGRKPASANASALVKKQLRESKACDFEGTRGCDEYCFCEIAQAEGDNRTHCLNEPTDSSTPGYCYIDPYGEPPVGSPALVEDCGATSKRKIRFVGPDTPTPGATTYIACLGATLH